MPGATYTVTVEYTDSQLGAVAEETLAFYLLGWRVLDQGIDQCGRYGELTPVTATPGHLSVWALLGETNRVYLPLVLRGQ